MGCKSSCYFRCFTKIGHIFLQLYFYLGFFTEFFHNLFCQIRKGSEFWVSWHGGSGAVVRKSSFDFRWFTKIGHIFHRLYWNIFWQIRKGSQFWVSWQGGVERGSVNREPFSSFSPGHPTHPVYHCSEIVTILCNLSQFSSTLFETQGILKSLLNSGVPECYVAGGGSHTGWNDGEWRHHAQDSLIGPLLLFRRI